MSWINSLEYKLCQPLAEHDRWFESTDTLDRIWSNYTETHRCLQILVPRRMSESEIMSYRQARPIKDASP